MEYQASIGQLVKYNNGDKGPSIAMEMVEYGDGDDKDKDMGEYWDLSKDKELGETTMVILVLILRKEICQRYWQCFVLSAGRCGKD